MLPSKLLYFMALARIENYTKAAEVLGISQPTLSNNIASLEEEIGVKLFEKSGRSIMLTKSGKVFLEYAEKSITVLEEGKAAVRKLDSEVDGAISVAHINIQSNNLLPSYIKRFIESSPSINTQFDLHIAMTDGIIAGIKNDEYDVGFCFKGENLPDIEYMPLWKEEFVIIVPLDHELAHLDSVSLRDSLKYPHITYSQNSFIHQTVLGYYKVLNKYPDVVGTVEVTVAMIGLVSRGVGVGFAPISAVRDNANVKYLRVSDVNTSKFVYMVYDKHKYQIPCVKRFVRYMEKNHRTEE